MLDWFRDLTLDLLILTLDLTFNSLVLTRAGF